MKEETIEQLFKRHYLDMYRLAKSYLYDGEVSKDIVSDVFADLIDSPEVLLPQTARQYLMTSVRNRCINIIRQKKLREQITHLYTAESSGEDSELYSNYMISSTLSSLNKTETYFR